MGVLTSMVRATVHPAASISAENEYFEATTSSGNRQHSSNARSRTGSGSVPRFASLIAANIGSRSAVPTSSAAARQLSRSKMMASITWAAAGFYPVVLAIAMCCASGCAAALNYDDPTGPIFVGPSAAVTRTTAPDLRVVTFNLFFRKWTLHPPRGWRARSG